MCAWCAARIWVNCELTQATGHSSLTLYPSEEGPTYNATASWCQDDCLCAMLSAIYTEYNTYSV